MSEVLTSGLVIICPSCGTPKSEGEYRNRRRTGLRVRDECHACFYNRQKRWERRDRKEVQDGNGLG